MNEFDIQILISIVKDAGKILKKYYKSDLKVENKVDKSPKTIADIESNEYIVKMLKRHFKDYTIVSEEGEQEISAKYFTVDPLAGTANFINSTARFDVMLGVVHNYSPILGLVYNPITDELWIGGRHYPTSRVVGNIKTLINIQPKFCVNDDIILTLGASKFNEDISKFIPELKFLYRNESNLNYRSSINISQQESNVGIRLTGGTWIWDLAATHAILEGAKGITRDLRGNEIVYNQVQTKIGTIATDTVYRMDKLLKSLNTSP